jgi:hypothetical protein
MGDRIDISDVSGSVVAAGRNSRARGVVTNGSAPDVSAVQAELTRLVEELRATERPEAPTALRHAENLREAIADEAPQAVDRSWSKLRVALGGLAVTANLAQIGQFVQAFVS